MMMVAATFRDIHVARTYYGKCIFFVSFSQLQLRAMLPQRESNPHTPELSQVTIHRHHGIPCISLPFGQATRSSHTPLLLLHYPIRTIGACPHGPVKIVLIKPCLQLVHSRFRM